MDEKKKPIMHITMPTSGGFVRVSGLEQFARVMKKTFGERYDVVFTPDNMSITTSDDNVVRVCIDNNTDIKAFCEKLEELAKG